MWVLSFFQAEGQCKVEQCVVECVPEEETFLSAFPTAGSVGKLSHRTEKGGKTFRRVKFHACSRLAVRSVKEIVMSQV